MDHKSYLSDPGITKKGKSFFKKGCKITDTTLLNHLKSIYVPPGWVNIWYSSKPKSHILATGIDSGGKKQYILSPEWIQNSKYQKYNRMKKFVRLIEPFHKKIKITGIETELNKEMLIKLLFNLLIDTHVRVGNEKYADSNGTYGLTTLLQKHLIRDNDRYTFSFVGKSNIHHLVVINKKYNPLLSKLNTLGKNKPLFWYRSQTEIKTISSEELNDYLKEHLGSEYTCKDFRTYSANVLFIKAFLKSKETVPKKAILRSIDSAARELGHSRSISKKSYISDSLVEYCMDSFNEARSKTIHQLISKIHQ